MTEKPDLANLGWAIDQRAKIGHTLLALYEFVRSYDADNAPWHESSLLDDLIAAAFSLWRSVFLADKIRNFEVIQQSQERFLAKLVSTNAITFSDDKTNSAWSFGFYLQNAMYRLRSARSVAQSYATPETQSNIHLHIRIHTTNDAPASQYEWEMLHAELRTLFRMLKPDLKLPVELPSPISGHHLYG